MSSGRFDDPDGDERARGTTDETVVRGSKGTKSTGKFSGANGANSSVCVAVQCEIDSLR